MFIAQKSAELTHGGHDLAISCDCYLPVYSESASSKDLSVQDDVSANAQLLEAE
mgnify:CR=1 FL=1